MVVNKIDILRSDEERAEVVAYVAANAARLLGVEPEVFQVSALEAMEETPARPTFRNHSKARTTEY